MTCKVNSERIKNKYFISFSFLSIFVWISWYSRYTKQTQSCTSSSSSFIPFIVPTNNTLPSYVYMLHKWHTTRRILCMAKLSRAYTIRKTISQFLTNFFPQQDFKCALWSILHPPTTRRTTYMHTNVRAIMSCIGIAMHNLRL